MDQLVGASTDNFAVKIGLFHRAFFDDGRAAQNRKGTEEGREGRFGGELDGVRVNNLNGVNLIKVATPDRRTIGIEDNVKGVLHIFGGEIRAIMPFNTLAQFENIGQIIGLFP